MNLLDSQRVLQSWRMYFETAQAIAAALEEGLRAHGSDLGEYNILVVLAEAPDQTLTASELASKVVFSLPRLTYRITQLSQAGLVTKTACPSDKRSSNITLTAAGMTRLLELGKYHHVDIQAVLSPLTPEMIAQLGDLSGKLRANL